MCEPGWSLALTPLLRNSIRTQEQPTNGSPSAMVGSPRLCELRTLDASEASASRWLCLLERATPGVPDAVAVELSSVPGSLEKTPVELMGFDDGGRLPLPTAAAGGL